MVRGRKLVLAVGAVVLAVASPLAFTLGSADVGDAVSASIIAATAVAALAVPLWPSGSTGTGTNDGVPGDAVATNTGRAEASDGGDANTGVRRRGGGGSVRAEYTGPVIAQGPGSRGNSGVDEAG